MKPMDVQPSTYSEYVIERNEKNSKFKIVDHVRISRYKNIFAKRFRVGKVVKRKSNRPASLSHCCMTLYPKV